jgi:3-oxoacyl-[acyl-carrier-protein] synthase III
MNSGVESISIGSFMCAFGDLECRPQDVAGFDEIWQSVSDAEFSAMGCGTFRKLSSPVEGYVADCIKRTLADSDMPAAEIDHLVISTTDACLGLLGRDFAISVLDAVGLVNCVPVVLSLQQCCSSVTALRYGWDLLADQAANSVVLVSVDFTPNDCDRIRPFAFFGDAVASCLLSRVQRNELALVSSAVKVDYSGLVGRDSFASRQKVAQDSFAAMFAHSDLRLADVTKVFPTNLYQPLTLFNATVAGVNRNKLHFTKTLQTYGHCGNCDWMINLLDYRTSVGIRPGETYLIQASAPGFFACGVLAGS